MAKLTEDARLKKTLTIEDGLLPVEKEGKKTKLYITIGTLIVWCLITLPVAIDEFASSSDAEDFQANIAAFLVMIVLPVICGLFYIYHLNRKKEKMTYKHVPNPEYDEEFAHKISTRIGHQFGNHVIHRYLDDTYTVDDRDEFYHLRNFSFSGSDLVTDTKGRYNGRNNGSLLGTVVGGLLSGTQGATLGNVNSRSSHGTTSSKSTTKQTLGDSVVYFLTLDNSDLKEFRAKITQNEATDLERFFYK